MCMGSAQMLHHFIDGAWTSVDPVEMLGSIPHEYWKRTPFYWILIICNTFFTLFLESTPRQTTNTQVLTPGSSFLLFPSQAYTSSSLFSLSYHFGLGFWFLKIKFSCSKGILSYTQLCVALFLWITTYIWCMLTLKISLAKNVEWTLVGHPINTLI